MNDIDAVLKMMDDALKVRSMELAKLQGAVARMEAIREEMEYLEKAQTTLQMYNVRAAEDMPEPQYTGQTAPYR